MPSLPLDQIAERVRTRAKLAGKMAARDPALGFDEVPLASAIRMAFNTVLRREPDDATLRSYTERMRKGELSREGLLDELTQRHGPDADTRPPLDAEDPARMRSRIAPTALWPAFPPPGYLGQLTDEFQTSLARERAGVRRDDGIAYHSIDLPDEHIEGPWDLRGGEPEYLGHVPLAGKRVLEFGPAAGYLSFWMEQQGAEVVGFDVGYDCRVDLMPRHGEDMRRLLDDHARITNNCQNMWWYSHRKLESKVKMAYGDVYNLPGDIGEFDVVTYGAILLHLRSPVTALEQGARRCREAIVVTDGWSGGDDTLMDNVMRPFPIGEDGRWVIWWEISAGAIVSMLKILGFGRTTVIQHTQKHKHGHDMGAGYADYPMYTVVGERG